MPDTTAISDETLFAHLALLALVDEARDCPPPVHWRHDLVEPALTWSYGEGGNSYTWRGAAVTEIADRWRAAPVSTPSTDWLLSRWSAVDQLLTSGGLESPDEIWVDHDADELTLRWNEQKVALVVGPS